MFQTVIVQSITCLFVTFVLLFGRYKTIGKSSEN